MSAPAGYTRVFGDEFDTLSLSNANTATANWYTGQAWGGSFGNARLMPVGGTGSPFAIVDQGGESALRIEMSRNASGRLESGLISNTFPDGSSTTVRDGNPYGYYEARLWLPEGTGIWPAFWSIERERLSPTRDHVVEVDVMEHYGTAMPDRYTSTVHDWNWNGTTLQDHSSQYQRNVTGPDILAAGWHTYGVEIRADRMTFFFDGQAHWSIATPASLDTDPIFMINLAAGAGWPIDPALDDVAMYVDYFRAYELANAPGPGPGQPTTGIPLQGAAGTSLTRTNADGSKTVARYGETGAVSSIKTTHTDGASDTFTYTGGVLTNETHVHADRSRDVVLSNITGRSYVAEHDRYDATGRLVEATRTRADGSLDYRFTLDAVTGTRVTDQYDAAGRLRSHATVFTDGASITATYTSGVLTNETHLHADRSRDVFLSNITGRSYAAEHDRYDATGRLIEAVRTRTDGSVDYRFTLDAVTGTRVTDQYDAAGRLKSHATLFTDGSSNTATYTGGVLANETQVHADGSRDVFLTNITGRSYAAEHGRYDPQGRQVEATRTRADGSSEYHYTFDPSTGARVTDRFDAAGLLRSHATALPDGSSHTFSYSNGVLTNETQIHADGSRDVVLSNLTGRSYVTEHDRYDALGRQIEATRTRADGSSDYHYTFDPETGTRVTDRYDGEGLLKSQATTRADGSSDTLTYTNGVLTNETQVHPDGSRDVFTANLTSRTHLAEHRSYDAEGRLETVDRTNPDGSHLQTAHQHDQTLHSTPGASDTFKSAGSDTFVFDLASGRDTIIGFHPGDGSGHDILQIDPAAASDLEQVRIASSGHDTVIHLGSTTTITLQGIEPAELTNGNFLFA